MVCLKSYSPSSLDSKHVIDELQRPGLFQSWLQWWTIFTSHLKKIPNEELCYIHEILDELIHSSLRYLHYSKEIVQLQICFKLPECYVVRVVWAPGDHRGGNTYATLLFPRMAVDKNYTGTCWMPIISLPHHNSLLYFNLCKFFVQLIQRKLKITQEGAQKASPSPLWKQADTAIVISAESSCYQTHPKSTEEDFISWH